MLSLLEAVRSALVLVGRLKAAAQVPIRGERVRGLEEVVGSGPPKMTPTLQLRSKTQPMQRSVSTTGGLSDAALLEQIISRCGLSSLLAGLRTSRVGLSRDKQGDACECNQEQETICLDSSCTTLATDLDRRQTKPLLGLAAYHACRSYRKDQP